MVRRVSYECGECHQRYHISYTKIRQGLQSYCTSCEAPANMQQAKRQVVKQELRRMERASRIEIKSQNPLWIRA